MPGDELAVVRFFAIVEVRVDGVLEQVHDAVAGHDEDGAEARAQAKALGSHLQQSDGHQEACAQGDKIAQVALDAFGAHQNQAAGDVGQRGNGSENEGELQHWR